MNNGARWAIEHPELAKVQGATSHKPLSQPTARKSRPKPAPLPLGEALEALANLPGSERKVIRFTVPGEPVSAPRMTRMDKWKQRPCVVRYREWKDAIRLAAGKMPDASRIESLSWSAYFEPPPSWSKSERATAIGKLHRSRPDRDNLDKACLDALFTNDAAIARGTIEKRWDWTPRLEVEIVYF